MSEKKPIVLIICDDNRIAREIYNSLKSDGKRVKHSSYSSFHYQVIKSGMNHVIVSTNGHLQVFQNSSLYKWT
ncbi:MAG: hypothetical protein ACTSWN_03930, partial [Promethearchaeota archaeon]